MDPNDFELDIARSEEASGNRGHLIALRSSGADSPRPLYLKRSTRTGLYFIDRFNNLYVGVRAPRLSDEEEFI